VSASPRRRPVERRELEQPLMSVALTGAAIGTVAGLVELAAGPSMREWVGNKQDTTRLGLATLLLAVIALAAASALVRRPTAPPARRLLLALGLLLPGLIGFTTTGRLWYLPGVLLVSAGVVVSARLWGERREIASVADRHWTVLLAAVLALYYVFLGATALGIAGAAGVAGGLVALGLVLARGRVPRSFAIPALLVAVPPFAAATWWSVATPLVATLLVALGVAALGAERRIDPATAEGTCPISDPTLSRPPRARPRRRRARRGGSPRCRAGRG
jgi:hypothetical protein